MSASYKFSASGGTLPRRVRDGDPHGRRLRHGGSVALGGSAALVQYSPARRTYFVRNDRIAGTRPGKTYSLMGDTAWTLQLATHYMGIGSEIRESGLDGTAKVIVNLPQGLGRYAVASASGPSASTAPSFEWYLKNHLGSTMLVYGTGASNSVRAAYDYRAFGEQVDLTVPADKVTENFTGKELDDETDLGYFGARYLDQMLGSWVSADQKRQFSSPYLYAGNGVNPVRFFDPSGFAMYQLAIYANGLSEKDRYDINGVILRLQGLEGFDFEAKYVDSQKELAEFTNRGTYTAVLAHGNYRESAFSQTKDFNGKIGYSDFDKEVLSGSFAKFFTCFSATVDDSRLEHVSTERGVPVTDQLGVVYDRYQQPVSLGDAAKDAGTYLLNTYKDDLDSQK